MVLLFAAPVASTCGISSLPYLDTGRVRGGTLKIGKPNSWFMAWTDLSFHWMKIYTGSMKRRFYLAMN